jgi:NMD protein affecting ribosome stability and mRNA decay
MAHEQGVTAYQVVAQQDKRTCPLCQRMDGKYFEVQQAYDKMIKYLETYERMKKLLEAGEVSAEENSVAAFSLEC